MKTGARRNKHKTRNMSTTAQRGFCLVARVVRESKSLARYYLQDRASGLSQRAKPERLTLLPSLPSVAGRISLSVTVRLPTVPESLSYSVEEWWELWAQAGS